ncbi:Hypothetical protein PHPALM_21270 [Phytophthora palmivora]|uniref:HTH cro/C1-type domain-containing protein n=1 Tax=Phytophthora palmivora TaxID=4796 RepID=A0A2P4XCT2_9STRA|nr:Hypothetical protein PHPALM_21270 [Phytophthora palmivora]
MRFPYIIFLVTDALFTPISAEFSTPLTTETKNLHTKILLRGDVVAGDESEERAINFKAIPGIEKLKTIPGIENLKKIANLFKTKITSETLTRDKLFESPDLNVWAAYTRMVTKTDPDKAIFTSLLSRYGEVALMKMTEPATKVKSTEDIAKTVQKMQLDEWDNLRKSVDDIFSALTLDNGLNTLLANPNLNVWSKYAKAVAKKNNTPETPMIEVLRTHYKDTDLLRAFKVDQQSPQTKDLGDTLEKALVSLYRARKNGS